MKRVLVVTPRFPPVNAPDHQRARLMLPFLREFGWEAEVLAVTPETTGGRLDPLLEDTIPERVPVHRVAAWSPKLCRVLGFGNLGWRSRRPLDRRAAQLLREKKFDAIFMTGTVFNIFPLAAKWKREAGVPFVLDFQDPWVTDYYERTGKRPPGGWTRYRIATRVDRRDEPVTLREASGVVSVSPAYIEDLARRHPWFDTTSAAVIPFGAATGDFEVFNFRDVRQSHFNKSDGKMHWVYVGAAGAVMGTALRGFFAALREWIDAHPDMRRHVVVHFIGTSYAHPGSEKPSVAPLAKEAGVADMVAEHPARVPYFEALRCMTDADALIVPGSDDPGYAPSKLHNCLLARRPMLAILHKDSPANAAVALLRGGVCATFVAGEPRGELVTHIRNRWFLPRAWEHNVTLDTVGFEPHTARAMTGKLASVFDRCAAGAPIVPGKARQAR
jgi:hypothetical protein